MGIPVGDEPATPTRQKKLHLHCVSDGLEALHRAASNADRDRSVASTPAQRPGLPVSVSATGQRLRLSFSRACEVPSTGPHRPSSAPCEATAPSDGCAVAQVTAPSHVVMGAAIHPPLLAPSFSRDTLPPSIRQVTIRQTRADDHPAVPARMLVSSTLPSAAVFAATHCRSSLARHRGLLPWPGPDVGFSDKHTSDGWLSDGWVDDNRDKPLSRCRTLLFLSAHHQILRCSIGTPLAIH